MEALIKMVRCERFQEWLKIQDNNNKFLQFLLVNDLLQDFIDEEIFIESDGDLYSADQLFYDIDEYLSDLEAFKDRLYYLTPETRRFFYGNSKWEEVVVGHFANFDADNFVDEVLLSDNNIESTKERLKDINTSIHFFKFLAENVRYTERYKDLPFYDVNGNEVEDFNNKLVFFHSEYGEQICSSVWMSNVKISFIHDSYTPVTKDYLKQFGVLDYNDGIIVKDIILSDEYCTQISNAISDNLVTSQEFINFCFKNKDLIPLLGLKSYTLNVFDCNGDSQWYTNDGNVYFPSSCFDYYSKREWIDSSWLTCLNLAYAPSKYVENDYKSFFKETFGIEEITDELFYKNIVRPNLSSLLMKIQGPQDSDGHKNIDFVKFLDDNYKLIFEVENDGKMFANLVIASDEGKDVGLNNPTLYIYDKELFDILNLPWFPKKLGTLTHRGYGASKALEKLGVPCYTFPYFYDNVIIANLTTINASILNIADSVAFHNFIIGHLGRLLPDQVSKMEGAKVYLYGVDTPVLTSSGHKILSNKANELFKLGLVQSSTLDLIASEYEPENNTEYWETRLGNSKFTLGHFATWLKANRDTFIITLQNKDHNLAFWRWLKDNQSDALLKEAIGLPIWLSDDNYTQTDAIFFSDAYLNDYNIESTVLRYNKNAHFLSPSYIGEDDDVSEWKDFFLKIGVKFDIVDILIETIDNSLQSVEDENLIKLITDNREALESHYEDNLVTHLHNLRVKTKDGNFYTIDKTVLINYDLEEPFDYIIIPNEISFSYPKENRLIDDLMQEVNGIRIQSCSEWQQLKLDHYLKAQDINVNLIRPIHLRFVNDLAKMRNSNRESLSSLLHIEKIKVLDRNNEFCDADSLTIGSKYNPFFDFEQCGITELMYVSDEYSVKCTEYVGRFFRSINMHRDFIESDIKHLSKRTCAVYFWTVYLEKQTESESKTKFASIQNYILDHKFDDVECIPTKDTMKRPSDLYYGTEVHWFINKIEDWENKTPLVDLPDVQIGEAGLSLFSLLPFKKSLDFRDALYALFNVHSKENRPQLVKWIIESFDTSLMPVIEAYREDINATWTNSQNERVQIKDLYALEYGKKNLEQYFGSNPKILNKDYLPAGDLFRQACEILKIRTITEADFTMEPVEDTICKRYDSDLRLFALVVAGVIDSSKWNDIYTNYCDKLTSLILHRCDSILIKCKFDSSISQDIKQFYHNKLDSDFYFVDDIYSPLVFQDFVDEIIDYLGVEGIDKDMVKLIMFNRENAIKIAQKNNSLMLDDDFRSKLISFDPRLKDIVVKKEQISDNDSEFIRPHFTIEMSDDKEDNISSEYHYGDSHIDPDITKNTGDIREDISSLTSMEGNNVDATTLEHPRSNDFDSDNERSSATMHEQLEDVPSDVETPSDDIYEIEEDDYIGSVENDSDYDNLGEKPTKPRNNNTPRRHPKPFTKKEIDRLRSNQSPLALTSLEATKEELEILSTMNITPEQIADTNYLAQLRLYQNLTSRGETPEESQEEFVRNASDVTTHKLRSGKYIHTCSAARGVMYISPSVWDKMLDDRWVICVYLNGKGNQFHYINSKEEFLQLVEKDDVVIKITGKEKVDVVNQLYSNALNGVKGTAYTLIRIAATTNMDAVFAHYVGSMAEKNDGNEIQEENFDEY